MGLAACARTPNSETTVLLAWTGGCAVAHCTRKHGRRLSIAACPQHATDFPLHASCSSDVPLKVNVAVETIHGFVAYQAAMEKCDPS